MDDALDAAFQQDVEAANALSFAYFSLGAAKKSMFNKQVKEMMHYERNFGVT